MIARLTPVFVHSKEQLMSELDNDQAVVRYKHPITESSRTIDFPESRDYRPR